MQSELLAQARLAQQNGNDTEALNLFKQAGKSLLEQSKSLEESSKEKKELLIQVQNVLEEAERLAETRRTGSDNSSQSDISATPATSGTIKLRILGHRVNKESVTYYGIEVLIQSGPDARTICGLPPTGEDERWILEKRYSQFDTMSKALKLENATSYTTANVTLPPKTLFSFGKDSEEFIKERTQGLANMLETIQSHSDLLFTRAFGAFMSGVIGDIRQRETMASFLKRKAIEQKRNGGGQEEMRKAALARVNLAMGGSEEDSEEEEEEEDNDDGEDDDDVEPLNIAPTRTVQKRNSGIYNLDNQSAMRTTEFRTNAKTLTPVQLVNPTNASASQETKETKETKETSPSLATSATSPSTPSTPSTPPTSSGPSMPPIPSYSPKDAYNDLEINLLGYRNSKNSKENKDIMYGVSIKFTGVYSKRLIHLESSSSGARWILDKKYSDFTLLYKTLKKKI